MYGPRHWGRAVENSSLSPVSYARYYFRSEHPFIEAQINRTGDVRFARPGWIVGAGSWFRSFYWKPYLNSGKVPLYGDGNQYMSLIDLDDCARQIIHFAERGKENQNLNIFNGDPVTQREFAETIARILNTSVQPVPENKFRMQHGRTASEAFSSSIPMGTIYPELQNRTAQKYPHIEAMLRHTLSLLKNN
jgi:nucleoside-diphosphate-sugar epimerase